MMFHPRGFVAEAFQWQNLHHFVSCEAKSRQGHWLKAYWNEAKFPRWKSLIEREQEKSS